MYRANVATRMQLKNVFAIIPAKVLSISLTDSIKRCPIVIIVLSPDFGSHFFCTLKESPPTFRSLTLIAKMFLLSSAVSLKIYYKRLGMNNTKLKEVILHILLVLIFIILILVKKDTLHPSQYCDDVLLRISTYLEDFGHCSFSVGG